ncbi:MAG: PAS domain-containing protein [Casimicrobiaceae bacterium]
MTFSPDDAQVAFLLGQGEMRGRMRAYDWRSTEVGAPEGWPQSLKTLAGLLLDSTHPAFMAWGRGLTWLYNDAFIPILGQKHPQALGRDALDEVWSEAKSDLAPLFERVFAGEAIRMPDISLMLDRHGRLEEAHFAFSYTPVRDDSGEVAGLFGACIETTGHVLSAQREAHAQRAVELLNERIATEAENIRRLFRDAPSFMCVLRGPEHVYEMANASYAALIGGREVIGKSVRDALPETVEQGFVELLDGVYRSGEPFIGRQVDVSLPIGPEGAMQSRLLDFVYAPVKEPDGSVSGIFVEGIDVTDRVIAEREARNREREFASLAEAAPLHVWAADAQGALYWFNRRVYESTGAAPGSLDGAAWARVVHPDDLPGAARTWGNAIEQGVTYETEFRIWSALHDDYRWYLVRAVPFRDDGGVLRWIGTNTDVDDKKRSERQLSLLNARLEERVAERTAERDRMWRLSQEIMLGASKDGTILATNPAWEYVLGWREVELRDTNFFDLVHPDDKGRTVEEARKVAGGALTTAFKNRYRHRDGSYRWISWTAAAEGDFLHGVGRDVTSELEAEAALRESEETLRQAQKMEAVGQLTGGIAHDFNNLLQGIVGSVEVVRKLISLNRSPETERFINSALSSAHRAAALTHRLLAFSRRQPLDPKPVQVNRLVSSMEELLRRSLTPSIRLELALSAGLWTTLCDAHQVENAILNLVLNARDALPDGGTVVIETSNAHLEGPGIAQVHEITPGQYVCIAIIDSGTGMSSEVVQRAFDPFFTTKLTGQGTGLGLSMVYGFARQSDGYAMIDSAPGRGTTVKVYLPRHRGAAPREIPPKEAPQRLPRHDGKVVLVVDDEAAVRELVLHMLHEHGYSTLDASDGAAGLKLLQTDVTVDLLITDIGLPGIDGRQMADAARLLRPNLRVLFMTGYAENAVTKVSLDPDMQMITKPFSMEAIARRVAEIVDGRLSP